MVYYHDEAAGGQPFQNNRPKEPEHWLEVEQSLRTLSANLISLIGGAHRVCSCFVFPTLGRNFGHAIYEALRVGRPIVISNRTPWRDLAGHSACWDISLSDEGEWVRTLHACVDMNADDYACLAVGANKFAQRWFSEQGAAASYADMFEGLIQGPQPHR